MHPEILHRLLWRWLTQQQQNHRLRSYMIELMASNKQTVCSHALSSRRLNEVLGWKMNQNHASSHFLIFFGISCFIVHVALQYNIQKCKNRNYYCCPISTFHIQCGCIYNGGVGIPIHYLQLVINFKNSLCLMSYENSTTCITT